MIELVRLTTVAIDDVATLLNEPRNARHLPLAGPMDADAVADWVRAKDAQWAENGYGPWAVLVDGAFAGWGGFQREDGDPDLALVLAPAFWGRGAEIADTMLDRGFDEFDFESVVIALPFSRRPDRVVARWGFRPDGTATIGGTDFRRYRLTRDDRA